MNWPVKRYNKLAMHEGQFSVSVHEEREQQPDAHLGTLVIGKGLEGEDALVDLLEGLLEWAKNE